MPANLSLPGRGRAPNGGTNGVVGEERHHLVDVCPSGLRALVQRIVVHDGETDHSRFTRM